MVTGTHDGQPVAVARARPRWRAAHAAISVSASEGVVTPGTVLTNLAHLRWMSGTMQLGPVTTGRQRCRLMARMIGPNGDDGNTVWSHLVTVPQGAVTDRRTSSSAHSPIPDIISPAWD